MAALAFGSCSNPADGLAGLSASVSCASGAGWLRASLNYLITHSALRFDSVAPCIQGRTIRAATLTFNGCPDYYTGYRATNGAPTTSTIPWNFDNLPVEDGAYYEPRLILEIY